MTTANHILTGTLLAVTIKEPAAVLPLALLSHFVLDAVPHYGPNDASISQKQKVHAHLRVEALGLIGIVALIFTGVYGWNLALLASFVAILPDFEWPFRYIFYERFDKTPPPSITAHFHSRIQQFERPWGLYVEIVYFISGYFILTNVVL